MSDIEITIAIFTTIAAVSSYWAGHRKGVTNTILFLEKEGIIDLEEEK